MTALRLKAMAVAPAAGQAPTPAEPQARQGPGFFGRYSERAQRAIVFAQEEARRRGTGQVPSEHVFLAILAEGVGGLGRRVLEDLGVDLSALQAAVESALPAPRSAPGTPAELPFTADGKALVMTHAVGAARRLGHAYVGTEHLLLGLYAERRHADLLEGTGATREAVERRVTELLH